MDIQKWTPPDGTKPNNYDLTGLTNEDIAFEIVRRSPRYQIICAMVDRNELDPIEAAASVGMYRFKHFEQARADGNGRPRFKAATASVYRHQPGKKYRRVPVSRDRVAIVVSLAEMSRYDKSENYLVEKVMADILRQEVYRFRTMPGPPAPRREKPDGVYRTHLEACLQLYDLEIQGKNDSEIVRYVPYINNVSPGKMMGDTEPARVRLRDLRKRNVKLFDELEIANILLYRG